MENKITLVAELHESASEGVGFGLPPEQERMSDLQYISAILVSTGMNLNGAVFMPSELIRSRDTMLGKPLDVEHIQHALVGHLYDRAFMAKDRSVFEPMALLAEVGPTDIDRATFDIAVLMKLYKMRFPEIADSVSSGVFKVSMECYYEYFDVMVGDLIISTAEAAKYGLTPEKVQEYSGTLAEVVMPDGRRVGAIIGRVLRNLMFSGCGLVEAPANVDSVILEAAATTKEFAANGLSLDLTGCEVIQKMSENSIGRKTLFTKPAVSINVITDTPTNPPAESARSSSPGTCVSYKQSVSQGLDGGAPVVSDDLGPSVNDTVAKEAWCSLFDDACTSFADATDARCLRNVLGRTVKEVLFDMDELKSFLSYEMELDANGNFVFLVAPNQKRWASYSDPEVQQQLLNLLRK